MKLVIVADLALMKSLLAIDKGPAKPLGEAASVFSAVMATPGKGIPQDLLEKAHCIVMWEVCAQIGCPPDRPPEQVLGAGAPGEWKRIVGTVRTARRRRNHERFVSGTPFGRTKS